MNAITRVYQQTKVSPFAGFAVNGRVVAMVIVCLCVLLSAVGVVYMKDLNRRLFIQSQGLQQAKQQYNIEWGKLLLEESAWSTQARVQHLATQNLNMVMPPRQSIVLVSTPKR